MPTPLHISSQDNALVLSLTQRRDENNRPITVITENDQPLTGLNGPKVYADVNVTMSDETMRANVIVQGQHIFIGQLRADDHQVTYTLVQPTFAADDALQSAALSPITKPALIYLLQQTQHAAKRFEEKIQCILSPAIRERCLQLLPHQDSKLNQDNNHMAVLSWIDICKVNQLAGLVGKIESAKTLAELNTFLGELAERAGLDDALQADFQFPADNTAQITDSVSMITKDADVNFSHRALDNIAVARALSGQNLTFEVMMQINHRLKDLKKGQLREIIDDIRKELHVDLPSDAKSLAEYRQVENGIEILATMRNPYIAEWILTHCPALLKNDDGSLAIETIEQTINMLNNTSNFPQGVFRLADLAQACDKLINKSPFTNSIPMSLTTDENATTISELSTINNFQRTLFTLDNVISQHPQFQALAKLLELHMTSSIRTSFYSADIYPFELAPLDEVKAIFLEITQDMKQGASLSEATTPTRLQQLLRLNTNELELRLEETDDTQAKNRLQGQIEDAHQRYFQSLQDILGTLAKNDNRADNPLTLQDASGRTFDLRVNVPDDAPGTAQLVVLENPIESSYPEAPFFNLLLPQDPQALLDKRTHGPERLGREVLWSVETQQWQQWDWDNRTHLLGCRTEDGKKAVLKYTQADGDAAGHWHAASETEANRFTWPSLSLAFPANKPVPMRAIVEPEKTAIFKDEQGLTKCLDHFRHLVTQHFQIFSPRALNKNVNEMKGALPANSTAFLSQKGLDGLTYTQRTLPEIEKLVMKARDHLILLQEKFAATIHASLNTGQWYETVYSKTVTRGEGGEPILMSTAISDLYNIDFESTIQHYTNLLSDIKQIQHRADTVLSKAQTGVQIKDLTDGADAVDVTFGEPNNNDCYVANKQNETLNEPVTHQVQTSPECQVSVTTDQHQTRAQFPDNAEHRDYIEGFHRAAEFSQGQLPINIRFNPKNEKAQAAAATLIEQALVYLEDNDLDPSQCLRINNVTYQQPVSEEDAALQKEDIQNARRDWHKHSPQARHDHLLFTAAQKLRRAVVHEYELPEIAMPEATGKPTQSA